MTKLELIEHLSDLGYTVAIEEGIVMAFIPAKTQHEYEQKAGKFMKQVKNLKYNGSFGCRPLRITEDAE